MCSAIAPDADSLSEKPVTVHVEELSGFKNIILYAREVGFDVQDDEAEVQKFLLYGTTNNLATAYFETMSGFTSTGATALTNIDEHALYLLSNIEIKRFLSAL